MDEPFTPKPGEPYWLVEGRHGSWVGWVDFRSPDLGWQWTTATLATRFPTREAAEAAIRLLPAALPPFAGHGRLRVKAEYAFIATQHVDGPFGAEIVKPPEPVLSGAERIAEERRRQIEKWDAAHDDAHAHDEILKAAQDILLAVKCGSKRLHDGDDWGLVEKHQDPIRRLEIAGALIAAEIDRRIREGIQVKPQEPVSQQDPTPTPEPAKRQFRGFDVVHTLKCWPQFFEALIEGDKRIEIRRDDREHGFEADDVLRLREFSTPEQAEDRWDMLAGYSGRELFVLVTHVLRAENLGAESGLREGFVALSVEMIRGVRVTREVLNG